MIVQKHYKPEKRIKQKRSLFLSIIYIFGLIFVYSVYRLTTWYIDSRNIALLLDSINSNTQTTEIDGSEGQEFNPPSDKSDPYWDYIGTNLLDVNFQELKKINQQTKGWIQVKGTNINYPFVQSEDNDFYLNHSFNKKYNQAGWIFLDYRNSIDDLGSNTILYGHGRVGDKMFGTLKNITKNNWYSNDNNHLIRISSEKHNSLWQVFSVYQINTTNDYLQTSFSSKNDFVTFLNLLYSRSQLSFDTSPNQQDKILTLSTCLNNSKRVVIHAKLIKISQK